MSQQNNSVERVANWLYSTSQIFMAGLLIAVLVAAGAAAIQSRLNANQLSTIMDRINRQDARIETNSQRINRLDRQ